MPRLFDFYDETALISRLTRALQKRHQEVVFLVGSPFSAPSPLESCGVPTVDGIVTMIRNEFIGDSDELGQFETQILNGGDRRYQIAFRFLQGNRGQPVANEIIRRAVLKAREKETHIGNLTDESCRLIEADLSGWHLSPGTQSLGELATLYPSIFGRSILTTNFDPLIEIAIRRAGGRLFRTTLHADGDLHQTEGDGCHVIHLHGYWYNSDTLNTTRQLTQERPRLKASLMNLLKDRLIVVCGYGGWDDVFTNTLLDLVRDDSAGPEVLWTFHGSNPSANSVLSNQLTPGIDRGRILLYSGIDCNSLMPKLLETWRRVVTPSPLPSRDRSNPVRVSEELRLSLTNEEADRRVLEGDDEDRPPLVELCLGREHELNEIQRSSSPVVFVTGIGGQGKSTIAAKYFTEAQGKKEFRYFLWRDCKEESERFENQIASVIETLSGGALAGSFLAKLDIETLVGLLASRLKDISVLFVFDNVDHYVNLETGRLTVGADLFVKSFLASATSSRVVFTCRPMIDYKDDKALSVRLEGISPETAVELFQKRNAKSTEAEIFRAHSLSNGHAFWLDLLALQVANRQPSPSLGRMLDEITRGGGNELPSMTLRSIWSNLKENERSVLRFMAETIRPETEAELGEYLKGEMNYNKLTKSLRALRAQNLIVLKKASSGDTFLELHPLVRHFVRNSFSRGERTSAINAIITVYQNFMGIYRKQLQTRPTFTILQHWSQAAELDIEAERIQDAINALSESSTAFTSSAFSREFSRTARLLLGSFDWIKECKKYRYFDGVFRSHVRTLSYLGEYEEADELLGKFELTIAEKDARFIFYCEMRCYGEWLRNNFAKAVEWGRRGYEMGESTGVDTTTDIAHSLALAERDAGRAEVALPIFLGGNTLEQVIDPDELDEEQRGAYYGNIGRCLQFMERIDEALICYQKSALLVEKTYTDERVINQGFIRYWIGELLISKNQDLGAAFLEAARLKWMDTSPPRAKMIESLQAQLNPEMRKHAEQREVEKICKEWIMGQYYIES